MSPETELLAVTIQRTSLERRKMVTNLIRIEDMARELLDSEFIPSAEIEDALRAIAELASQARPEE